MSQEIPDDRPSTAPASEYVRTQFGSPGGLARTSTADDGRANQRQGLHAARHAREDILLRVTEDEGLQTPGMNMI